MVVIEFVGALIDNVCLEVRPTQYTTLCRGFSCEV